MNPSAPAHGTVRRLLAHAYAAFPSLPLSTSARTASPGAASDLDYVCDALSALSPADLLSSLNPASAKASHPSIDPTLRFRQRKYGQVFELQHARQRDIHLSLWILPRGTCLPLHDHPDMTVLMRHLYGELEVRSFDWMDKTRCGHPPTAGLSRLTEVLHWTDSVPRKKDTAEGNGNVAVFKPHSNNLHEIRALSDAAFFDVIAPPYDHDEEATRICTYYGATHQEDAIYHLEPLTHLSMNPCYTCENHELQLQLSQ